MPRDFNGTSDFLAGGDLSVFNNATGDFSWHIWTWIDVISTNDMIFWSKCDASFNGLSGWMDSDGPNADLVYEMFNAAAERIAYNAQNIIVQDWVSVGGYVDWSGVTLSRLYINGVEQGNDTITTNNMTGQDLFLGKYSGGRFHDGKLSHFSIWDTELSAANFLSLAGGADPETIGTPLRYWKIAGSASPETEEIDGTDTLTVTGAIQSANPVISSADVQNIADTACEVVFTSDHNGGTARAYISTSATPPSVADLKAGTGAVATADTVQGPIQFTGGSQIAADVDAVQAVASNGTWYFTAAGNVAAPDNNEAIVTYNSSWVEQSRYDTASDATHSQIAGLFCVGNTLYAVANNFSATPEKGWIIEYDINPGTGAISNPSANLLSIAHHAEGMDIKGSKIWVCSNDYHGLDSYDLDYSNGASHAFPAGDDPGGVGGWQGLIWFDNVVLVNLHKTNASSPRCDTYDWDGTSFSTVRTEIFPAAAEAGKRSPATVTGQGITLDTDGTTILWADRNTSAIGDVWSTTAAVYKPSAGVNRMTVTGLSAGTNYYAHILLDHTQVDAYPFDSNVLTSTQFTTTGTAASGKKKHAPKTILKRFPRRIKMGIR